MPQVSFCGNSSALFRAVTLAALVSVPGLTACGGSDSPPAVTTEDEQVPVPTPPPASEDSPLMNVAYSDVLSLYFRLPDAQYDYGADAPQFGALWLPTERQESAPVVVFLHGGCWLNAFDIKHTYPMATALADAGYAVWSLEYRRTGDEGGGWPGTFDDVKLGVEYLSQLSQFNLDFDNVVLAGHSAGGHLALLAASQVNLGGLKGAVGLAAITDIARYAQGDNSCQTATPRFMGGTPEELPEAYREANPKEQMFEVNVSLLQGSADTIVPQHQALEAGFGHVVIVEGAGHFDWIHPGTGAYAKFLEVMQELTER